MRPEDQRLEEGLRHALRREEPSPGFAERVLANVRVMKAREPWWRRWTFGVKVHALRYATAVVLVLAVVLGTLGYRRHERERREGELAKQQVLLALRIASRKLQYAQAKVSRAGGQAVAQPANLGSEERQ